MRQVSFEGIGETAACFAAKEGVQAGMVVQVTGDGEVGPCQAGDAFCGVALEVRDGYATVQLTGCARVKCSGSVAAGPYMLAADGSGGVKNDNTNGVPMWVLEQDAAAGTVTVLL